MSKGNRSMTHLLSNLLETENKSEPVILPPVATWRLGWKGWLELLGLGLSLWLIFSFSNLLLEVTLVLFGAFLLALAIHPLAESLNRRWFVPRGMTVIGVYLALAGLVIFLGDLLVPVISAEISNLQNRGPALLNELLAQTTALPVLKQWLPLDSFLANNLGQRLGVLLNTLVGTVTGVGSLTLDVLITLVLAYFFTTDTSLGTGLMNTWIPIRYQPRARLVVRRLQQRLTRWIWAQLGIALYFAVVFSTGLSLLHIPFALTIGLVGGALEIVPYLGGVVAFFLAAASALTVDPWLVVWVGVFYLVVTEIESHVVAPAFYGRIISLHPVVVLVALLIGAKVKGILGVFFAVPIAVVLAAILHEVRMDLLSSQLEPVDGNSREE